MKIKVVMPDKAMDRATLDKREVMLSRALSNDCEISVDCIKFGPDELDCNTDEIFAGPELVREAIKAEKEGYDAFVIYCFSDVAIDAIRENVSIPVIGPGETSLAVASMSCNKFAVITTEEINVARTYRRLNKNVIAKDKMTSVRAMNVFIGDLSGDQNASVKALENVCRQAIEEDDVDGIILGCLGMAQYSEYIESILPVKIFDPAFIAVAYAEMCARLKLAHVEKSYPKFKNASNVDL